MLEEQRAHVRNPWRRRRWRWGLIIFILANVFGSSVQIATLPLIVLAPLHAVGLIFNVILASLLLGEPFTRTSLVGTVLTSTGASMVASFGAVPEPTHDLEKLLLLFSRPAFIAWAGMMAALVAVLLLLERALLMLQHRRKQNTVLHESDSHLREAAACLQEPTRPPCHPVWGMRLETCRGVLLGVVSGILSGHSLLLAKAAVELVLSTVQQHINQFTRWQSWVIVVCVVVLALVQLYFLNRGLRLLSTSVLYPLVFCVYNVTSIVASVIYYRQAHLFTLRKTLLVGVGALLLLSGVFTLSWKLDHAVNASNEPQVTSPLLQHQNTRANDLMSSPTRHTRSKSRVGSPLARMVTPEDETSELSRRDGRRIVSDYSIRRHNAYGATSSVTLGADTRTRVDRDEAFGALNDMA